MKYRTIPATTFTITKNRKAMPGPPFNITLLRSRHFYYITKSSTFTIKNDAHDITLSQIFDDNSPTPELNNNEIKYIEAVRHLSKRQQEKLIEFLKTI